jgi:hypothetical protein
MSVSIGSPLRTGASAPPSAASGASAPPSATSGERRPTLSLAVAPQTRPSAISAQA